MKAILAELPSTAREMAERDTGGWPMVGAWEMAKRLMRTNSAGELMDAPGRAPLFRQAHCSISCVLFIHF
jgi:hypothetical protein